MKRLKLFALISLIFASAVFAKYGYNMISLNDPLDFQVGI